MYLPPAIGFTAPTDVRIRAVYRNGDRRRPLRHRRGKDFEFFNDKEPTCYGIAVKCLRTLAGLFSPNLIDQSSCRILISHARTRPIFHNGWSIRLGENRPDRAQCHRLCQRRIIGKEISRL